MFKLLICISLIISVGISPVNSLVDRLIILYAKFVPYSNSCAFVFVTENVVE